MNKLLLLIIICQVAFAEDDQGSESEYYGKACKVDADCGTSVYMVCKEDECDHKNVLPIQGLEIAGTVVLTILMALAVMAGIGGGGIVVPMLMVFYHLQTKNAIAVSGLTILLGSLGRYIITLDKRHPKKDATCIDYGLSNVMLPTVLVGSVAGVFFNLLLPAVILQICLTLLLLFLTIQSLLKAKQIYKKENQEKRDAANGVLNFDDTFITSTRRTTDVNVLQNPSHEDLVFIRKVEKIKEREKTHLQWKKQGINFLIFTILLFVNLFRGSKKFPSIFGIEHCSLPDWLSLVFYFIVCVLLSFYSVRQVKAEQWLKINYSKGLSKGDVELEGKNMFKLIFFSFFGGWVSGALGLGGGSIFNPLLLSMGVPPQVASATGMYMIIFSTGASTMTYIIEGMLNIEYGFFVGFFCLVGTFSGMKLLDNLMKKLNRQSPLVMLLTLVLGISALAVPYFGYQQLKDQADLFKMGHIC